MDNKAISLAEIQALNDEESEIIKECIISECKRIIYLLENDAHKNKYGYGNNKSSELYGKMKELRRDTIKLKRINTEWGYTS